MQQAIITTSPEFTSFAQFELKRLPFPATFNKDIAPGIMLINLAKNYSLLGQYWQKRPPIYIRHSCPVDKTISYPLMDNPSLENILQKLKYFLKSDILKQLKPQDNFAIQLRLQADLPHNFQYILESELTQYIQRYTGLSIQPYYPQQVISLLITNNKIYISISPTKYNLSYWSEGASPGSWTKVLMQYKQQVVSVDTKPLLPFLLQYPAIDYQAMTAEDYLNSQPNKQFDIITNDMIQDPQDSAYTMLAFADYLKPKALGIMILKLKQYNRLKIMDHSLRILRKAFDILLSLKEEDSYESQVKTPHGVFRFLLHRTLPKEIAWFSPKSSHVVTFTALGIKSQGLDIYTIIARKSPYGY